MASYHARRRGRRRASLEAVVLVAVALGSVFGWPVSAAGSVRATARAESPLATVRFIPPITRQPPRLGRALWKGSLVVVRLTDDKGAPITTGEVVVGTSQDCGGSFQRTNPITPDRTGQVAVVVVPSWVSTVVGECLGNPVIVEHDGVVVAEASFDAGFPPSGYADIYEQLLGRSASTEEVAYWNAVQIGGAPLFEIVNGIANSDEAHGYVLHRVYEQYLRRAPDPAGLAYWVAAMRTMGEEHLLTHFLSSDEYVAERSSDDYVAGLFEDLLGRAVEPVALDYYRDLLDQFQSHQQIAGELVRSAEFRARQIQVAHLLANGNDVRYSDVLAALPCLSRVDIDSFRAYVTLGLHCWAS